MLDPRRLAALDMHGRHGSERRRRIIRAEFVVGAIACAGLGALGLANGTGVWKWIGAWLIGVAANYVALSVEAFELSAPGALEEELEGLDVGRELRRAGLMQLWIAVPFAVAIAGTARGRGRSR